MILSAQLLRVPLSCGCWEKTKGWSKPRPIYPQNKLAKQGRRVKTKNLLFPKVLVLGVPVPLLPLCSGLELGGGSGMSREAESSFIKVGMGGGTGAGHTWRGGRAQLLLPPQSQTCAPAALRITSQPRPLVLPCFLPGPHSHPCSSAPGPPATTSWRPEPLVAPGSSRTSPLGPDLTMGSMPAQPLLSGFRSHRFTF